MSIEPSQTICTTLSRMTARPVRYLIYSQEQAFRHMTVSRPDKERQLYIFTDEILFFVWDALSLSINEDNREVYFPYLPHVFDLLKETEDGHEICDYLSFIEEARMGAVKCDPLSKRRAWRVAGLLLEYKAALFLQS